MQSIKPRKISQLRAYCTLSFYFFKAMTRNPATFAFGFLFPIVFISIFGIIGGSGQKVTLGIPNTADMKNEVIVTTKQQNFIVIKTDTEEVLHKQLQTGKIAGILTVERSSTPPQYTAHLLTSQANPADSAALITLMSGIVDKLNLRLAGITQPSAVLVHEQTSGRQFRYIDFALPGQIGFSLLSTAVFGTVFGLVFLKKSLVLKRMFATPTQPLTILVAQGTSRWVMAMLQTLLIIALGVFVFKFYLPHGWLTFVEILIISSIGLVAFLGFGYFMAGLANDENSAGPLVNLITLPQFLLSGTFFAIDNLPVWIQPIANNLPLSYFNHAIRIITTEGGSFVNTWPYLLGLSLWGIVMYLLAAKTFKWT